MNAQSRGLGLCLAALVAAGCSHSAGTSGTTAAKESHPSVRSKPLIGGFAGDPELAKNCQGGDSRHEVSEYDTSGDGVPDVRKVFLKVGDGALARLVLVCRETDLNADGNKDVVRWYTNEGRPIREEADRNFDGQMDEVTVFQDGQILRQEFDTQGDGKVDTKIFFDSGRPLRAERDLKARSTADKWQPDRWEYFEEGRVVRMGTDVDGDGTVDRWDRDSSMRHGPDMSGAPASTDPA